MRIQHKLGSVLKIAGLVFQGQGETLKVLFPDAEKLEGFNVLTRDQFKDFIKMVDFQETEIIDGDSLKKVIVRKSQRQIDPHVQWEVFHRDGYRCRYCGRKGGGVQMTYDHVKLWEDGGETSVENGVCACKRCNNRRGRMDYKEWLESDPYRHYSKGLAASVVNQNKELAKRYESFPLRKSTRSR